MNELIYCQRDIPKDKWRYGLRSSRVTGCGWISVYNALLLMNYGCHKEKLIKYFENQVPLINGNIGTFLFGPAMFFKKFGFGVKTSADKKRFDSMAKQADVCILYFWWKDKFKIGAHFVALQHTDKGFVGYNTYKQSSGPDFYGDSLESFLNKRKYFGAMLTCITDKRK